RAGKSTSCGTGKSWWPLPGRSARPSMGRTQPVDKEGPPLETLLHRLAECPPDFLAEPRIGTAGVVEGAAVVSDLLGDLGGVPPTRGQAGVFQPGGPPRKHRNRLRVVLVAAWLLHDPWFCTRKQFSGPASTFLAKGLDELAELVQAPALVS